MSDIIKRNSRIELLRIVSMVLIVAWHWSTQFCTVEGNAVLDTRISLYHGFAVLFGSWGQIGVDLFIIISVYFLQQRNAFKAKKVIDLVIETMFYGLLWVLVSRYILHIEMGIIQMGKSVFSLFFGSYWFATAYLLMYVFSPVLNTMLNKCTIGFLKKVCMLLLLFVSAYKTLYKSAPVCDFMLFICIYVLIYTIEHSDFRKTVIEKGWKWFSCCTLMLIGVQMLLLIAGQLIDSDFIIKHNYYLNLRGSIFILFDAICLFYIYTSREPAFTSAIINLFASTCFGVFLSHQGNGFLFWNAFLTKDFGTGWLAIIYMIFAVTIIFLGCSLIDLIRQYTLGYIINRLLSISTIKVLLGKIDKYINEYE